MEQFDSSKESSSIWGAEYYPETETLRVIFKSGKSIGGTYDYAKVPGSVWEEFKKSESKGKFFAADIRNHFKSAKVS